MRTDITIPLLISALSLTAACGGAAPDAAEPISVAATDLPVAPSATTATGEPDEVEPATAAPATTEPVGSDRSADAALPTASDGGEPAAARPPGWRHVSLTADEEAAADTVVGQAILRSFPAGFAPPTPGQGRCVAGKTVLVVGERRLGELGLGPDTDSIAGIVGLTDDELDDLIDALFECVDMSALLAGSFGMDLEGEQLDCVAGFFDESLVRSLAEAFLGGGTIDTDAFLATAVEATDTCLDGA